MYTWLCRVMAVLFTFNILSPAYAQVPLPRVSRDGRRPLIGLDRRSPGEIKAAERRDASAATLDSLRSSRAQYMETFAEELAAAQDAFLSATTQADIDAAYKNLDQLRRTGSGVLWNYKRQIGAAVKESMDAQNAATFEYYAANPHVAPDAVSQTMGRDMRYPVSQETIWKMSQGESASANCPTSNEFLEKLNSNKFDTPEEMLDYLDPMGLNCRDYLAVAYAAETLFYMMEEFTTPKPVPDGEAENLKVFLAHAQKRASESLKRLNAVSSQEGTLYMARGTLRILLAILQNAVDTNHLQLSEPQLYFVYPSKAGYKKAYPKPKEPLTMHSKLENDRLVSYTTGDFKAWERYNNRPTYEAYVQENSYFYKELPANVQKQKKYWNVETVTFSSLGSHARAQKALDNGNFKGLQDPMGAFGGSGVPPYLEEEFLNELRAFKAKNPSEDSKEMSLLRLDTQYAAQFAVLSGNSAMLSKMVAMFEEKPGKNIHGEYTVHRATDFNTPYSSVLSALFNSVYETLNNFYISQGNVLSVFDFLKEMAGPSHATDTRILALGTLGMLTQPIDPLSQHVKSQKESKPASEEEKPSQNNPANGAYFRVEQNNIEGEQINKYWLSYQDRFKLGQYVADIYAPMQNTGTYGMESYGLNAEQMLALSDQLSGIYMRFLPLEAPKVTFGPCLEVKKMDTKHRIMIDRGTFYAQHGGTLTDGNCQTHYTSGGTFVFTSKGTVEMLLDNHINWKKQTDETTAKGMEILGESLLWVFGGAIIGGAFRGMRLLVGVAKNLPRALRAGQAVYKTARGSRVYRMAAGVRRAKASIQVGVKYSSQGNFTAHLAKNGMAMQVERTAAEPGLVKATSAVTRGEAPRIPAPTTRVTVTSADASSGLARSGTFGVNPDGLAGVPVPLQRAQFLRFVQSKGLLNDWGAAERAMFNRNIMFRNVIDEMGIMPWNSQPLGANRMLSGSSKGIRNDLFRGYYNGMVVNNGYYPGMFSTNHPVLSAVGKSYWNTVKFFYGFKAFDTLAAMTVKDPFNRWMMRKQEESVNAEVAQHGDSLSSEAMAEVEAQGGGETTAMPSDIIDQVGSTPKEKFGWVDLLTLPSYLWQQFAPTEMDAVDGSSILPPFMYGKYLLSKTGVVNDPFAVSDAMKQDITFNAYRMDLTRARIGKVNTQLAEAADTLQKDIDAAKRQWISDFAQLKRNFPGDWSAEERAVGQVYDAYKKEIQAAAKITNITERSKRLEAINQKYEKEINGLAPMVEKKQNQILLDRVAPQGEAAFFQEFIGSYEQQLSDFLLQVETGVYSAAYPSQTQAYLSGMQQARASFIGQLKSLAAKKVSFLIKCGELDKLEREFNQKMEKLGRTFQESIPQLPEPSVSAADYPEMY